MFYTCLSIHRVGVGVWWLSVCVCVASGCVCVVSGVWGIWCVVSRVVIKGGVVKTRGTPPSLHQRQTVEATEAVGTHPTWCQDVIALNPNQFLVSENFSFLITLICKNEIAKITRLFLKWCIFISLDLGCFHRFKKPTLCLPIWNHQCHGIVI